MTAPLALTDRQWTASLTDEALPALRELLTDPVPGPLARWVAGQDGTVTSAAVRRVTWWPGRSATVSWDVSVEGGALAGRGTYVGTTVQAPDHAVPAGSQDAGVTVWRVPQDPFLPALATALQPELATALLADAGGHLHRSRTRLRAYRPTRRAVVEVSGEHHRLYLKVVRPRRLAALHRRHLALEGRLPVPELLGLHTDLGLLAMRGMTGTTLRRVLENPSGHLPPPDVVVGLLGTLPRMERPATVRSSIDAVPRVADLLQRLVPAERDRVAWLVEHLGTDEVTDRVPAHGDFHEGQLLVEDGRLSGLLDVDTFGVARPGDDAGTMLGHLAVWGTVSRRPQRVAAYATQLQQDWEAQLDPRDLRRRAAARILGLAAGPFRVQQPGWPAETVRRIALAHHWVESAISA